VHAILNMQYAAYLNFKSFRGKKKKKEVWLKNEQKVTQSAKGKL
jgi:hypothetical protein